MAEKPKSQPKEAREARLAEALRANLKRRKPGAPDGPAPAHPPED